MKRILLALLLALSAGPALAAAPPNPPSVSVVGGNASLSVSGVTARVALPVSTSTFPAVTLINDGTTEVFWQGGDTSVVATTGNYPLQPGRFISVWMGSATNIAAITAGGSSTLRVIQFNGASTMGGAPDGSGAGGTVTLGAGSAIAGKFGIDQTTPGTTNGVQVNAALPAGANIIGKTSIDQTTPGTTNGVQVNAALPAGANIIGKVGIDTATSTGITGVVTSSGASSLVVKNAAGNLLSVYATNLTATAGFLAIVNATSAPIDGAITPLDCVPLPANGSASIAYGDQPGVYSTGITAVVTSATTCFTKTTGVITAFIRGSAL